MGIDKGYTKAAYLRIAKLMPNQFQINDLPHANSGMLRRGVDYGIIAKVRNGWYKVQEGITDPWHAYSEIATRIRAKGNPKKREGIKLSRRDVVLRASNIPPPPREGPSVSIAS